MLAIMLLVIMVIFLVIQRWKERNLIEMYKQLKSDFIELPFIGHAYHFIGNTEHQMNALFACGRQAIKYSGIAKLKIGFDYYVVIADPVNAEYITKKCLEKGDIMKVLHFISKTGSIFAPVSIWRYRRKIVAPAFSTTNLNKSMDIFTKISNGLVESLRPFAGGDAFSLFTHLLNANLNANCETSFGVSVNSDKNNPVFSIMSEGLELASYRIVSPWLHNDLAFNLVPASRQLRKICEFALDYIGQLIKLKQNEISTDRKEDDDKNNKTTERTDPNLTLEEDGKTKLKTVLEILMQASDDEGILTTRDIQEELLLLMIAATDTSATGAAFILLLLSRLPDIQEKVYAELTEVFGDSLRPVVLEDLSRLQYLTAVIKETLRLYPPVPVALRKVTEDIHLPSGVYLAEGCQVFVHNWAINRNPRYWGEDAELFRPERFLDTEFVHPAQFMTFSYGPRNCIGYRYGMMSLKVMLSTVLRRYRVLPAVAAAVVLPDAASGSGSPGGYDLPPIRVKFGLMMKDVDEFKVRLELRH